MEQAVALRDQLRKVARAGDVVPSYNDLVVKACGLALHEHPRANAAYRDGAFELYERVNVGIAVAAEDILIVPTVFDADRKSLIEIAREARTLADRARQRVITPAELSGATFTVSNLGMHGVASFAAIINPPQAAILAVGELREQPVVRARPDRARLAHEPGPDLRSPHPLRRAGGGVPGPRASAARAAGQPGALAPAGTHGPCQPPYPATSFSACSGPQELFAYGCTRGGESSSGCTIRQLCSTLSWRVK